MNQRKIALAIALALSTGIAIFIHTPDRRFVFADKSPIIRGDIRAADGSASSPGFADMTLDMGLYFAHEQGDRYLTGINESLGAGACVLDFDQDGWQDLFLVNGSGQNRYFGKQHWWQRHRTHQIFRNIAGRRFENVTSRSGLSVSSWGMGCLAADFDNDGYTDILVTNIGPNLLFKNKGDGSFVNVPAFNAANRQQWSTSACAADFDRDGLLDLFVANFIEFEKTKLNYEGQSEFAGISGEFFNSQLFPASANRLYKNNGNLSFSDITERSGVFNPAGRSLAVRCADVNGDHLPDILVGNDASEGGNRLFINQGNFRFDDFSERYHFQNYSGSRNIAFADIDNDGVNEIFLSAGEGNNARLFSGPVSGRSPKALREIGRSWGISDNPLNFLSNWGSGLHDFNRDGLVDLWLANGFLTPDPDTPRIAQGQPNQLWINTGRTFRIGLYDNSLPPPILPESSRSTVFADFDNDGDMDIYIGNNNNLGQLLINESPPDNHWLGVQLTDRLAKRNLVGAKVTLANGINKQIRSVAAGDAFLSDSEDRLLFGLGNDRNVDELSVTWPDGSQSRFNNVRGDRYIRIDINEGMSAYPFIRADQNTVTFPVEEREFVPLFLQLLSERRGFQAALPFFRKALESPDAQLQQTAIDLLADYNSPESAALLIRSINSGNDGIGELALSGLCGFEQEHTIRWLVSTLTDSRPNIAAAGAHCFETLFYEEEAMIHRKLAALPWLIGLLDSPYAKVQVAAARALARAENYRAVGPLLSSLTSPNSTVRAETARALGLIREKKSEPSLLMLLQNPKETSAVTAQGLIALKRLNYHRFNEIFENFFRGVPPYDKTSDLAHAKTLAYLVENKLDGIVIDPHLIARHARRLIEKTPSDEQLVVTLIPLLESAHSETLLAQLDSPNQHIRSAAYVALLQDTAQVDPAIVRRGLKDHSQDIINKLLEILAIRRVPVSSNLIVPLLQSPETAVSAIRLLGQINNEQSWSVLGQRLSKSPYQASILHALAYNPFAPSILAEPYLTNADPEIKKAAVAFQLHKFPPQPHLKTIPTPFAEALASANDDIRNIALNTLIERRELWAMRLLEEKLTDVRENESVRLNLLKKYKHPFEKKWLIVLKIAGNINDPLRASAIQWLIPYFDQEPVSEFFKSLATSPENAPRERLIAFEVLASDEPDWVLNMLTEQ